jgi:hypothetical protein
MKDKEVASIDVVKDVIDATCIRWVSETLVSRCVAFSWDADFMPRNSTILLLNLIQFGEGRSQRGSKLG